MPRCKPRLGLRFKGARTTALRDHCRNRRSYRYVRRGGRSRSSAWWRAWIARLLGGEEQTQAPPPTPPVPLSSDLDRLAGTLTITFDGVLDPASTVVAAQFRYGNGAEMYTAFGTVQISGATVTVSILTPPQLPFGSGAWMFEGSGELLGVNGLVVQPFGPV